MKTPFPAVMINWPLVCSTGDQVDNNRFYLNILINCVQINHQAMARFLKERRDKDIELSSYRDLQFSGERDKYEEILSKSTTLYVGNLSFYTTEEQLYELFGKCGDLKRVIMGIHKDHHTPCGFCFVEYHDRDSARDAIRYINGTRLDDRIIRTDWDTGFKPGRQYGRGKTGGQVRDDFRTDYDEQRGGFGFNMQATMKKIESPAKKVV